MELTLENLILYLEKEYPYGFNFSPQFILREIDDGIGALDILENIASAFNVSFENFDFNRYFLSESELNRLTWKVIFEGEKQRNIEKELTIQELYDYMLCNKKASN